MANDTTVFAFVLTFFLLLGVAWPFVAASFGLSTTTGQLEDLQGNVEENPQINPVSSGAVVLNIFTFWVWTFGGFPLWANIALLVPRLISAFIIVRAFFAGG